MNQEVCEKVSEKGCRGVWCRTQVRYTWAEVKARRRSRSPSDYGALAYMYNLPHKRLLIRVCILKGVKL